MISVGMIFNPSFLPQPEGKFPLAPQLKMKKQLFV